ncbi:NAD(P)-dependent oxidoreductase [Streptomyces sp. BRA346]|uniref:NAD(P)-dependent oxidoreductase n=1 Tax=Streptomyces sp. BRA346 TaxID=2878199 RepID=UPI00406359DF
MAAAVLLVSGCEGLGEDNPSTDARASDNPWAKPVSPPAFMTNAARSTLAVMGEQGIRRIVLASTQGAGDDWAHLNPLMRAFIRGSNLKTGFADHDGVDRTVRASGTDWTLARAVALSDRTAGCPVRAAERGTDKPGMRINRADFAGFLLEAVEKEAWIRQAPLVWNARAADPDLHLLTETERLASRRGDRPERR